jgi:hypothetical protein
MVIVHMLLQSNASVAHANAEQRRRMRNRLLVLANGLQEGCFQKADFQETARRRRSNPASAPPSSGPITGIGA